MGSVEGQREWANETRSSNLHSPQRSGDFFSAVRLTEMTNLAIEKGLNYAFPRLKPLEKTDNRVSRSITQRQLARESQNAKLRQPNN